MSSCLLLLLRLLLRLRLLLLLLLLLLLRLLLLLLRLCEFVKTSMSLDFMVTCNRRVTLLITQKIGRAHV